ncbi:MAG: hypothetical protein QOJ12_3022, partial [Thermoleophilales bacterium]|nr:hypothetical protein [Thermoleophilales bacterium]
MALATLALLTGVAVGGRDGRPPQRGDDQYPSADIG